jgi:flagellar motor switch protein FliN
MDATNRLDHLHDVPLDLYAELDRRLLKVRDILQMKPGAVLTTNKSIEQGIDVYVEGVRIGSGEVVALGNRIELRFTGFAAPPKPRRG